MTTELASAAITPDVLRSDLAEEERDARTRLRQALETRMLLRDIGDGLWSKYVLGDKATKKVAEILLTQLRPLGRLVKVNDRLGRTKVEDHPNWVEAQWLEAIGHSHAKFPVDLAVCLAGATPLAQAKTLGSLNDGTVIERTAGGGSVACREVELSEQLRPFLAFAKFLHIVDPALDPSDVAFSYLDHLIRSATKKRSLPLLLTVHTHPRVHIPGGHNQVRSREETRQAFESWGKFSASNVVVQLCIWDRVHDRFIASNLGGLDLGNGLADRGETSTECTKLGFQTPRKAVEGLRSYFGPRGKPRCIYFPESAKESFRSDLPGGSD